MDRLVSAWPALRQDLALYPGPPAADGAPVWQLHDPAANRYYLIAWPAFEMLERWDLGDAQAVADAVSAQTTLTVDVEQVHELAQFLDQHHLFERADAAASARLGAAAAAGRLHWARWLLHNYLFLRIPLLRPERALDLVAPHIGGLLRRGFWLGVAALGAVDVLLVARQWDVFVHTFEAYQGVQRLLSIGLALSLAKVCHELGHALVARHHGCKVPTMGVALLVGLPVLYTDTNEAWKLSSRRARFQISVAGIATELLLALLATLAWVLLPDGGARSAMFFLASTSLLLTLSVNASPFMRFDGYFLLSDALGMPNLHSRAFALGRWRMREALFGLGAPPPEALPRPRRRFLVAFAYLTWVYRAVLFLSIAYLVYARVFKLLGIVLLAVEVGWFIARPVLDELHAWWGLRAQLRGHRASWRSALVALAVMLWVVVPWQTRVAAPAVLAPGAEQAVFSPVPARIVSVPLGAGRTVRAGQVLLQLSSDALLHRIALAQLDVRQLGAELDAQPFDDVLRAQGPALRSRWEAARAQLDGLERQAAQLVLRAPFDGAVVERSEALMPGVWVTPRQQLLALADRRRARVDAYVGEAELARLHPGARAVFIPEASGFGRVDCRIEAVDAANLAQLDEPMLASVDGGPLPARRDVRGDLVPVHSLYRVRLGACTPARAPRLRLRGTVLLDADRRSRLAIWGARVLRVLVRESGF